MGDNDCYAVRCPECDAKPGNPCVYLPLRGVDPDFVHYRSAKVQARHALTGTPTRRPHNGRRNTFTERRIRRWRAQALKAAVVPATTDRIAAARALREYDLREYQQLREWFARHGRLFT